MKKMDRLNKTILAIIVALVVIFASLFIIYKMPSKFERTGPSPDMRGTFAVNYPNNDTMIKITGVSRKYDINETKWQILSSAEEVILEGEVYDIYDFGKIGCLANDVSHSKGGYMKTDDGENITNSTISNSTIYWENYATKCPRTDYPDNSGKAVIVFLNNDEKAEPGAWKLSAEDQFAIRGLQNYPSDFNGKKIEIGDIFELIYKPNNELIGNVVIS